jgi:hypothetical protein
VAVPLDTELRTADAVFAGRVTALERTYRIVAVPARGRTDTTVVEWAAQIAVDRVWKGRVPSNARVITMQEMALSGDYELEADSTYLIIAKRVDDREFRASSCSRTAYLSRSDSVLAVLGAPSKHIR